MFSFTDAVHHSRLERCGAGERYAPLGPDGCTPGARRQPRDVAIGGQRRDEILPEIGGHLRRLRQDVAVLA
jgi:hypothetical protein